MKAVASTPSSRSNPTQQFRLFSNQEMDGLEEAEWRRYWGRIIVSSLSMVAWLVIDPPDIDLTFSIIIGGLVVLGLFLSLRNKSLKNIHVSDEEVMIEWFRLVGPDTTKGLPIDDVGEIHYAESWSRGRVLYIWFEYDWLKLAINRKTDEIAAERFANRFNQAFPVEDDPAS